MKPFRSFFVVVGLTVYGAAFYATSLVDFRTDDGEPMSRLGLLVQLLLRPDDWLWPNWFGDPPGFTILDRLPVALTATAILAWAALLGWLANVLVRAGRQLSRLETFVFSTAVGLSLLSTWTLLLGLFGVMDRWRLVVAPMAVTLAASVGVWRRTHLGQDNSKAASSGDNGPHPLPLSQRERGLVSLPLSKRERGLGSEGQLSSRWLWLALPFVAIIFLAAMLPPLDFDSREYHSQAPKEFFQLGRIAFLPHNVYANMPLGSEMLSLLAMVISGDWWLGALAGKTVIAAMTPLTALGLYAAGRRFFSPTAGIVAALVYLSIPWVVSVASGGFVEGALACYLFLAVYALMLQTDRPAHPLPLFALAGYMAGAAVATKYPAVLFVLLPLAVWVLLKHRSIKSTAVFLLAAAVACGLWFGKNWVLTGNPTYPLLYEYFDGKTWTAEKDLQWNRVHRPDDFSAETLGDDLGRVFLTSPWLSPLVVPLALMALLGGGLAVKKSLADPRRLVWALFAYTVFLIFAWWLFTHRIDRFWIPVLPVVALLAGLGACWSAARWWRIVLVGLLLAVLPANFLVASMGPGNSWFVPLSRLRNDPAWIGPWRQYFNDNVEQGRLLCVGDAAVFDLDPPTLYNTCFDDCIFERLVRGKTPQEIRASLADADIAYVYVDWGEIDRYRRTYGFTDYVQPEVFNRLVGEGILEPLPWFKDHPGRGYRVNDAANIPPQASRTGRH